MESFSIRDCNQRGFLHVVDATFDSAKPTEQTPAYGGTFQIIDQLIWTDLYALHVNRTCQSLSEFWALAAEHPEAMYVGPTTGIRRKQWRKMREALRTSKPTPHFENGSTKL